MAKTSLFDRLRRSFRRAAHAEHAKISTSEVLERREAELSRRALLRAAGATVGGVAATQVLAACGGTVAEDEASGTVLSALQSDARIVIVGAGLAGMTCAYRLGQRGLAARVYDANNRVGGRTFTHRSPAFPNRIELGGELIDTNHATMQTLVRELGLTLVDVAEATAGLEYERYFFGNRHYTEAQIIDAYRPVAKKLRADFKSIGQPRYSTYDAFTPRGRELDRKSIAQWLDENDVSGPIRTLLDVGYTAEYGGEIDTQSFLNLLHLISFDPDPFLIYGESDERYTIKEGNDSIATRIDAQLANPVTLGHELAAVRERSDGSLLVTFERGNGSTVDVVADKLVLAIPFNQLRKCDLRIPLGAAKKKSLTRLAYGKNSKVTARVSSRPWIAAGSSGTSFNDRGYMESWDASRGFPGAAATVTHFGGGNVAIGMGSGTAVSQAKSFLDRLDVVYPGVRAAFTGEAVRMHWPTAKYFEGSYAIYTPGDYTTFVGSEGESEGNVHFAGEHTSVDFQGWMEGAAESGERVAKEIRKALKMPA